MQITRDQLKKLIIEVMNVKVKTKKISTDDFVYVVVDYNAIGLNYITPKTFKKGEEEKIKQYIIKVKRRSLENGDFNQPLMRVIKCKPSEIKGKDEDSLQEYAVELIEDEPNRLVFFDTYDGDD